MASAVSLRETRASFSSRPRALQPKRRQRCLVSAVLHRATLASFSNRPRTLQPKRRQRHGALRCSKRARRAAVPSTGVWRAWSRIVRRGLDFQAALGLFRPSAGTGMARFAAVSVQDTLPRRHSLFGGAVSLHATWASFSSRPRALQTQHRQRHGALAAVSCARHAAMPSTGVWRAWSRIVRRGPAFQAAQGPFSPSAGSSMAPSAAVSVQDTQ